MGERFWRWLSQPGAPRWSIFLGMALCVPALFTGFVLDDYFHLCILSGMLGHTSRLERINQLFNFIPGEPAYIRQVREQGSSWWISEQLNAGFWRPLSALTHGIDTWYLGANPLIAHIHSLLWYLLLLVLAGYWFRRHLSDPRLANLALLLYAIDRNHAMAAGWIAGRNGLIAPVFGVATLILYDRARRDGWKPGAALSFITFAAALLAAEAGAATGAYLLAYALILDPERGHRRFLPILPHVVIGVAWVVIRSLGGFHIEGMEYYIDPFRHPVRFLIQLPIRASMLLLSQFFFPPTDVLMTFNAYHTYIGIAAAIALIAMYPVVRPLLREDRDARFFMVGLLLAMPPICAGIPNDRNLMFVGLGGSAILAQLAGRYVAQKRTKDWFFRVNVVVHLVISPLMVPLIATSPRLLAMALGEPLLHVQTSAPLTGRTAVLINPTYTFSGTYLSLVRQYHGLDFPQGVKSLVPGIYGVALKRIDEHSLEVRPVGGVLADLFARLWRSNQETFEVGMHVRMADWDVEVLELDYQGWPTAIRVSFDRPLDDPELVFLAQDHQTLVETRIPPVGETLTLPAWTP